MCGATAGYSRTSARLSSVHLQVIDVGLPEVDGGDADLVVAGDEGRGESGVLPDLPVGVLDNCRAKPVQNDLDERAKSSEKLAKSGDPSGIRTRVHALKGHCPGPDYDGV